MPERLAENPRKSKSLGEDAAESQVTVV